MKRAGVVAVVLAALTAAGCASEPQGSNTDPDLVDAVEAPAEGTCRVLAPADVAKPVNATQTTPCTDRHTAETFHVAETPDELEEVEYDDPAVADFAYQRCSTQFRKFIGADASNALRTVLSWAWFRPSRQAWGDGARWIRCDVIGGTAEAEKLRILPGTTRGVLSGRPKDRWLVCAAGRAFRAATKVPCDEAHDWRAVTTIKVGEPEDPYPGDDTVASRTDSFCESSVRAWLNYPADYEFAITWFDEQQWDAGNRLSVCWARTTE
ncbi:septum formation family protein [Nocardioides panacisoli]|uniref:septum formation family protein n=1 Tax=Nocardioides panacisoli TaxID=627624 RepID=UPI001C62CD57|nr:septum formation family protein [Nocardioides panacisoli]QYJ05529.1 septum formation family protein [Nocardioides panacisoli]